MSVITLKVEGMHCSSCEKRVRFALEDVEGVVSAEVSHEARTATITCDDDQTPDTQELVEAITDEGFTVIS